MPQITPEEYEQLVNEAFGIGLSRPAQFGHALGRGVGSIESMIGGAISLIGMEELGKEITRRGKQVALYYMVDPAITAKPFNVKDLGTWDWWFNKAPEQLPTLIALIATYKFGGRLATSAAGLRSVNELNKLIKAGKIAAKEVKRLSKTTSIVNTIGATVIGTASEAAMEAGDAYNSMIDKGYSREQAAIAGKETFARNLYLMPWNALQYYLAFGKVPRRFHKSLSKYLMSDAVRNVVKKLALTRGVTALTRGTVSMSFQGVTEGAEEVTQAYWQKLGEDYATGKVPESIADEIEKILDTPEGQEQFWSGAVMGLMFHGIGKTFEAGERIPEYMSKAAEKRAKRIMDNMAKSKERAESIKEEESKKPTEEPSEPSVGGVITGDEEIDSAINLIRKYHALSRNRDPNDIVSIVEQYEGKIDDRSYAAEVSRLMKGRGGVPKAIVAIVNKFGNKLTSALSQSEKAYIDAIVENEVKHTVENKGMKISEKGTKVISKAVKSGKANVNVDEIAGEVQYGEGITGADLGIELGGDVLQELMKTEKDQLGADLKKSEYDEAVKAISEMVNSFAVKEYQKQVEKEAEPSPEDILGEDIAMTTAESLRVISKETSGNLSRYNRFVNEIAKRHKIAGLLLKKALDPKVGIDKAISEWKNASDDAKRRLKEAYDDFAVRGQEKLSRILEKQKSGGVGKEKTGEVIVEPSEPEKPPEREDLGLHNAGLIEYRKNKYRVTKDGRILNNRTGKEVSPNSPVGKAVRKLFEQERPPWEESPFESVKGEKPIKGQEVKEKPKETKTGTKAKEKKAISLYTTLKNDTENEVQRTGKYIIDFSKERALTDKPNNPDNIFAAAKEYLKAYMYDINDKHAKDMLNEYILRLERLSKNEPEPFLLKEYNRALKEWEKQKRLGEFEGNKAYENFMKPNKPVPGMFISEKAMRKAGKYAEIVREVIDIIEKGESKKLSGKPKKEERKVPGEKQEVDIRLNVLRLAKSRKMSNLDRTDNPEEVKKLQSEIAEIDKEVKKLTESSKEAVEKSIKKNPTLYDIFSEVFKGIAGLAAPSDKLGMAVMLPIPNFEAAKPHFEKAWQMAKDYFGIKASQFESWSARIIGQTAKAARKSKSKEEKTFIYQLLEWFKDWRKSMLNNVIPKEMEEEKRIEGYIGRIDTSVLSDREKKIIDKEIKRRGLMFYVEKSMITEDTPQTVDEVMIEYLDGVREGEEVNDVDDITTHADDRIDKTNSTFVSALNMHVSNKEYENIVKMVRKLDAAGFHQYLLDTFENYDGNEDLSRAFWVKWQPENRVDYRKKHRAAVILKKYRDIFTGRFVVGSIRKLMTRPVDFFGIADPTTETASFLHFTKDSKGNNVVDNTTIWYLSDTGVEMKTDDGVKYFKGTDTRIITEQFLQSWHRDFVKVYTENKENGLYAIVGVVPGAKPYFIFTKVSDEILEMAKDENDIWDYLSEEMDNGNLDQSHVDDMIKYAFKFKGAERLLMAFAQEIAIHEWYKSVMGNKYSTKGGGLINISKRLKLALADGFVATGYGNYKLVTFDKEKTAVRTKDGRVIDLMRNGKYVLDGHIMTNQITIERTSALIGDRTKAIKGVIYHKSDDGENVIAVKGQEMVIRPDLEFIDKETGRVIARSKDENGRIILEDANRQHIDFLISNKEAKVFYGDEFKLNETITLPEMSRRIKLIERNDKTSVPYPFFWHTALTHKWMKGFRKNIDKYIELLSNDMKRVLATLRENPDALKVFAKRLAKVGGLPTEVGKLLEVIGKAVKHEHFTQSLREIVKTHILTDGFFKGKVPNSGSMALYYPDILDEIKNENEVIVGSDNVFVRRYVNKKFKEVNGRKAKNIDELNKFLEKNKVWMIFFRQPINDIYGVAARRIVKLDDNRIGNVIIFHINDVYGRSQADHDGDHSFIMTFDNRIGNLLNLHEKAIEFMNSEEYRKLYNPVDLDVYETIDTNLVAVNPVHRMRVAMANVRAVGSVGRIMNVKMIRASLEDKGLTEFDIEYYEGRGKNRVKKEVTFELVKSTDMVTPKYMKRKDGKVEQMTSEKEFSTLAQAATDNPKYLLLGKWGYDEALLMTRLFKRKGDKEPSDTKLSPGEVAALQKILKEYNTGAYRHGMVDGKNMGLSKLQQEVLQLQREMEDIKRNPIEQLVLSFADFVEEWNASHPDDIIETGGKYSKTFIDITESKHSWANHGALTELINKWYPKWIKEYGITKEDAKRGRSIARRMMTERDKLAERNFNSRMERLQDAISARGFDYNEEFIKFIDKWLPEWNKLDMKQKIPATIAYLSGLKGRHGANIRKLLPMDLSCQICMSKFFELWAKYEHSATGKEFKGSDTYISAVKSIEEQNALSKQNKVDLRKIEGC